MMKEAKSVRKLLNMWYSFGMRNGLLYREVCLYGETTQQLLLPAQLQPNFLRAMHVETGHPAGENIRFYTD